MGESVLVGTVSSEKNELLSRMLTKAGIKHNVLNAKNHEREAEIVAQAGKLGAVTVAARPRQGRVRRAGQPSEQRFFISRKPPALAASRRSRPGKSVTVPCSRPDFFSIGKYISSASLQQKRRLPAACVCPFSRRRAASNATPLRFCLL